MLPSCLGRQSLLEHVCSQLDGHRWVTLVGPPGVGKSLVARHAVLTRDAVWIDVRAVDDLDGLVARWLTEVADDLAPGDDPVPALHRALEARPRLTVLDGITDPSATALREFLEGVVSATTNATILCTSATSAGSAVERVVHVGPLPVPVSGEPLDGPAVELFIGRMAAAGGRLPDLARDEPALRRLLEASGGIPLAIEQMAAQGAQAGLARVVVPDSLGDAIAASYAMVGEQAQRTYRRLGRLGFSVGMDVFAAIAGLPRVLGVGLAAQLQRHSLIELSANERVRMLAPVRRHALDVGGAGDSADALDALVAWADATLPKEEGLATGRPEWLDDLAAVQLAVEVAAAAPDRLDAAYVLANRAFDTLYSHMLPASALRLFEVVLASGDGPPEVGAQVARRAGICASEIRGTFEGLKMLDRADEHAASSADVREQLARTASIRAEMFLDAGQLYAARDEVARIVRFTGDDSYALRQARRTLMDVEVSAGNLTLAEGLAPLIIDGAPPAEEWLAVAARLLLAHVAAEQGRDLEALAAARGVREDSLSRGDDRIALLADLLIRQVAGRPAALTPEAEGLPWAIRLGYQLQAARDLAARGDLARAAGGAADIVVLADSARLERDGVAARLLLGDVLLADGDRAQALSTYASAARRAAACPLPLRVADAFDGLAAALGKERPGHAAKCAWVAADIRAHRGASRRDRPAFDARSIPMPAMARNWVKDGDVTQPALASALRLEDPAEAARANSPVSSLTKAQLAVAELVGAGLSSKEIAERLYLSPRTVDNHLAQIYRRLEIPSRTKLASLMAELV